MGDVTYTTQAPLATGPVTTLVVACSAGETHTALREFLERGLQLPEGNYDLLAVPGGPQFLLLTEHLPKFAWVGQKWLRFAVDRKGITRVILVAHDGCLWYGDERFVPSLIHRLTHDGAPSDHQREDLRQVAAHLRSLLGTVAVEAYYLAKSADGSAEFHREA